MLANSSPSLSLSLSLSTMPNAEPNNHTAVTAAAIPSSSRPNGVVLQPNSNYASASKQQQHRMQRLTPKEFFQSVASNIASQPLPRDSKVWGVLTAISNNSRKIRNKDGIYILLTADEHYIGRLVENVRSHINSNSTSAIHCKIYRMRVTNGNMRDTMSIFLKDTSTNGTYLNWEKLKKDSDAVRVRHGDIISLAAPPDHELAFAFVYREASVPAPVPAPAPAPVAMPMPDNAVPKRKSEELGSVSKRLKGLSIGFPDGPVSLDDFRSLQRSNTELRKQLENQGLLIDTLRSENRAAAKQHENELKSVKESVAKGYLGQLKELQLKVELKQRELGEADRATSAQKKGLKVLNDKLSACMQSCAEANDIISSQKVNIAELKEQLDEEKRKRKAEQEKAANDLKAAVQRAQSEAQEKLRRLADAALRREREVQETINKLQDSKRESSLLVETLRSELEDTRQKLVVSDDKVRQLETQVHKEQLASANGTNRVREDEEESRKLWKELESEKVAREEAWAKVAVLELEINAAKRDLDFERQRLKGAKERLMLRESQLRMFYSTTEDIQSLCSKQQEQLKAVQRTLENEENYENASIDIDGLMCGTSAREKEVAGYHRKNAAKSRPVTSEQKLNIDLVEISSDEASVTEKHDIDLRSEECQNMHEPEFTSAYHDHGVGGGFGSNIDGVGTAPMLEGDTVGTERVLETGSPANSFGGNSDLDKCDASARDTMLLDVQETEEHAQTTCREVLLNSQSNNPVDTEKINDDTQVGERLRTADLVTCEVAVNSACNAVPFVHEGNESTRSRDNNAGSAALHDLNRLVAECRNTPEAGGTGQNDVQRGLNEMIDSVAPAKNAGSAALYDLNRMVAEFRNTPDAAGTGQNDEQRGLNEMIDSVAPDNNADSAALHELNRMATECLNTPDADGTGQNDGRRGLNEMTGVISPDNNAGSANDCDQEREKSGYVSDSQTESCIDTGSGNIADEEIEGGEQGGSKAA